VVLITPRSSVRPRRWPIVLLPSATNASNPKPPALAIRFASFCNRPKGSRQEGKLCRHPTRASSPLLPFAHVRLDSDLLLRRARPLAWRLGMEERGDVPDPTEKDPLHCGLLLSLRRVSPPPSIRGTPRPCVRRASGSCGPGVLCARAVSALSSTFHAASLIFVSCPSPALLYVRRPTVRTAHISYSSRERNPLPGCAWRRDPSAERQTDGRAGSGEDPAGSSLHCCLPGLLFSSHLPCAMRECSPLLACESASRAARYRERRSLSTRVSERHPTPVALPFPRPSSWTTCCLSRDSWSRLAVPPARACQPAHATPPRRRQLRMCDWANALDWYG
jgi:hypothetical protein